MCTLLQSLARRWFYACLVCHWQKHKNQICALAIAENLDNFSRHEKHLNTFGQCFFLSVDKIVWYSAPILSDCPILFLQRGWNVHWQGWQQRADWSFIPWVFFQTLGKGSLLCFEKWHQLWTRHYDKILNFIQKVALFYQIEYYKLH